MMSTTDLDGLELVRHALARHSQRIALVSSFGAESAVLLDMVASVDRRTHVIFLDTARMFAETLIYQRQICAHLKLENVQVVRPDVNAIERFDPRGELARTDPDSCCYMRKTEPLDAALSGFEAWITGRKRFQGGARIDLPVIEREVSTGRVKYNPLAHWSLEDIRHYRRLRQLPLHPLLAKGYASIGCQPCTSRTQDGENLRAGRWRGLDKTECGIH